MACLAQRIFPTKYIPHSNSMQTAVKGDIIMILLVYLTATQYYNANMRNNLLFLCLCVKTVA